MSTCPLQSEAMAWGSHLPALFAAIGSSFGPVLELGVGHFSTPVLHAFCGALGRDLVSVENNLEWLAPFSEKYSTPTHQFFSLDYRLAHLTLTEQKWGVVFIDHSPGGANRAEAFKAFRDISQFVVVHDYHLENLDAISPLIQGLNIHVTTTYQPPTLIASNNKIHPSILCL